MDVFSLGILFYQMLTGELPFKGKGRRETFQQILDDTPPPPHRIHPAVPPELSDLGMDLLGKGRGRRIATADELITSIEAYLAGVGLTDYEPVLALYLADPKGNRDAVRREIVNGYLRVGKRAVERNERDRVFDLFRRVLYLTGVTVSGGHLSEEAQPTRKVILRERRFFWIWLGVVALVLAALFLVI
jgi:serine/threonine protein kinase